MWLNWCSSPGCHITWSVYLIPPTASNTSSSPFISSTAAIAVMGVSAALLVALCSMLSGFLLMVCRCLCMSYCRRFSVEKSTASGPAPRPPVKVGLCQVLLRLKLYITWIKSLSLSLFPTQFSKVMENEKEHSLWSSRASNNPDRDECTLTITQSFIFVHVLIILLFSNQKNIYISSSA